MAQLARKAITVSSGPGPTDTVDSMSGPEPIGPVIAMRKKGGYQPSRAR